MKAGDIVKGRITGIKPYGAFVKLENEMDGLVHISEISDGFVRSIEDFVSVGDIVSLEVLNVSEDAKVSLSYKRINKQRHKKYIEVQLESGFTPFETKLPEWIEQYQKNGKDC
ncbi:MAG: S1 RNA-binding domain-containing protein [Candidatus Izemoplasmatales bacterium]|jgi:general stress protein 13|nr:S1 RNA-binding domain-containing protein [Candidatus Izemoplasmatales bacterium]